MALRYGTATVAICGTGLVLADPPWGISYKSRHNKGYLNTDSPFAKYRKPVDFEMIEGDDEDFDPSHLLGLAGDPRVAIFGAQYFANLLPNSRSWIVWDKKLGNSDNGADGEMAWTNFGSRTRILPHLWRGIYRAGEENVSFGPKLHPHQKPVSLLRRIIEISRTEGLVVDPYCGSGSVACAALDLGRPSISIDCDEKWCEVAALRLERRTKQALLPLDL